jgi:predicted acylesterase/phospholipase RssA
MTENVLVLQGGGFSRSISMWCIQDFGKKNKLRMDIVAGTSMRAINGAIIVGSKSDHPDFIESKNTRTVFAIIPHFRDVYFIA